MNKRKKSHTLHKKFLKCKPVHGVEASTHFSHGNGVLDFDFIFLTFISVGRTDMNNNGGTACHLPMPQGKLVNHPSVTPAPPPPARFLEPFSLPLPEQDASGYQVSSTS